MDIHKTSRRLVYRNKLNRFAEERGKRMAEMYADELEVNNYHLKLFKKTLSKRTELNQF